MTEEKRKFCPFTLGNVVPSWCCEEDCMAWQYEYTDLVKPNWEKQVVRHGYCKLI